MSFSVSLKKCGKKIGKVLAGLIPGVGEYLAYRELKTLGIYDEERDFYLKLMGLGRTLSLAGLLYFHKDYESLKEILINPFSWGYYTGSSWIEKEILFPLGNESEDNESIQLNLTP